MYGIVVIRSVDVSDSCCVDVVGLQILAPQLQIKNKKCFVCCFVCFH